MSRDLGLMIVDGRFQAALKGGFQTRDGMNLSRLVGELNHV